MIANNSCFADFTDGYFSQYDAMFAEWIAVPAPPGGIKIHVSVAAHHAEIVARSVLPKLRDLKIHHKVVKNLEKYHEQLQALQSGKFITIYTMGPAEQQKVINSIDPELDWMGMKAGPVPTTRDSNHQTRETGIGKSGLLFMRPFKKGD